MKKRLLTAIIALAAYSVNAQWINQNVPLVYEGFVDGIKVVDANTAWGRTYSNASGTLARTRDFVRTIDGGTTWTKGTIPTTPTTLLTSNIYPLDQMTCYASLYFSTGPGGRVYKTSDGGASWAQVGANMFTAGTSFADFVYFWNPQNGIAMGDPIGSPLKYEIYLTTDSGVTWVQVPGANLPALTDPAEYGIVDLYDAVDGHIWFGTTYGDVYRSTDGGNTWTKSATGLPPYLAGTPPTRQDITKVAFTDTLNGLALQFDAAAGTTTVVSTNDGGLTWNLITPSGNLYPGDVTGVPGSDIFVSAGSSLAGGFGTSFSLDNGLTWNDLDASSHTCIDFADSLTGFSGEYINAAPTAGGAWKFSGVLAIVNCGSPLISAGSVTMNDTIVCFGDTLLLNVVGAIPPIDGALHGYSIVISNSDISGHNDILGDTSVIGSFPLLGGLMGQIINDGTSFPSGLYYLTPVALGNATGITGDPITFLQLDTACTVTGNSVLINLRDVNDSLCISLAIPEITPTQLGMNAFFNSDKNIDIKINSPSNGKTNLNVYDLTGRNVLTTTFNVTEGINHRVINAGHLGAGAYIIKVQTGSKEVTSKLVKVQ